MCYESVLHFAVCICKKCKCEAAHVRHIIQTSLIFCARLTAALQIENSICEAANTRQLKQVSLRSLNRSIAFCSFVIFKTY